MMKAFIFLLFRISFYMICAIVAISAMRWIVHQLASSQWLIMMLERCKPYHTLMIFTIMILLYIILVSIVIIVCYLSKKFIDRLMGRKTIPGERVIIHGKHNLIFLGCSCIFIGAFILSYSLIMGDFGSLATHHSLDLLASNILAVVAIVIGVLYLINYRRR